MTEHQTAQRRLVPRGSAFCVLLFVLLTSAPAFAQSAVPATLRAAILLRALDYEKSFAAGVGPATVVVLGGGKGSKDAAEMAAAMKAFATASPQRRPIQIKELNETATIDSVRALKPAAVYVPVGNEAMLAFGKSISSAILLCGTPELVGKGCTLSVETAGTSSRLVVDFAAAETSGRVFDARLLRLSRVIR